MQIESVALLKAVNTLGRGGPFNYPNLRKRELSRVFIGPPIEQGEVESAFSANDQVPLVQHIPAQRVDSR
jgi:hypothetical protein